MGKILQYAGLALVTLVAVLYGFILIGGVIEAPSLPADAESWGMAVLSILTVLAAVVCWVRRRTGAWLMLAVGLLFSTFALVTAGRMHWIAVMASGFPLMLGSVLILLGLRLERQ